MIIQNLKNKLLDAKYKVIARPEVADARLNICNSCEFLFQPTKNCKKCGCFVVAKVHGATAKCPENKW